MPNLFSRLTALETRVKALETGTIWIDLRDNVVRIDVSQKKGKEITFGSVPAAGKYAQEWRDRVNGNITGIAEISFIADLFHDDRLPTEVRDELVGTTGVICNLTHWSLDQSFEDLVLQAWSHSHMEPSQDPYSSKYQQVEEPTNL